MKKIIYFKPEYIHLATSNLEKIDYVIICLCYKNLYIPHPFSNYILTKYSNATFSTKKDISRVICSFLNYYISINPDNILDFTLEDIEDFINSKSLSGLQRETILYYNSVLTRFILYLSQNGLISDHRFYLKDDDISNNKIPLRLILPTKSYSNKINNIPKEYQLLLIDCAIKASPEIAFGVLLQITGGLRLGEVVNLTKSSIKCIGPYGKDGFIVDIKKRNLRNDIQTGDTKKPRKQLTIGLGEYGARIYKMHLDRYSSSNNSDILFINRRGLAMTDRSYFQKFQKVKELFIKTLLESDNPTTVMYGIIARDARWGTHIGRGIFSNRISDKTNSIGLLTVSRGDSSFLS